MNSRNVAARSATSCCGSQQSVADVPLAPLGASTVARAAIGLICLVQLCECQVSMFRAPPASSLLYPGGERPRLALSVQGEWIMNTHLQDSVSKSETSAITATRPSAARRTRQLLRRLWRDQRGANFIEYGVLAFFIGVTGMTFVGKFGKDVQGAFERLGGSVANIGNTGKAP
jgi:Flp pilus assembly pilin Flp